MAGAVAKPGPIECSRSEHLFESSWQVLRVELLSCVLFRHTHSQNRTQFSSEQVAKANRHEHLAGGSTLACMMRRLMAGLAGCSVAHNILLLVFTAPAVFAQQTTYDFLPNEARQDHALEGHTSFYQLPGTAASASCHVFHFNLGLRPVRLARWWITWNPRGDANSGVRLYVYTFDRGWPPAVSIAAELTGSIANSPIVSSTYLTKLIEEYQSQQMSMILCEQVRGPLILFSSRLELVWE